jgi:hypothetical protein
LALFHAEERKVPGSTSCAIVRRLEGKGKGKKMTSGRIAVSRKQVSDAIDEWHCENGHIGIERTVTYCQEKYFNCTQWLVRIYCLTCLVCMRKNPVTKPARGSRKPILSQLFVIGFRLI